MQGLRPGVRFKLPPGFSARHHVSYGEDELFSPLFQPLPAEDDPRFQSPDPDIERFRE